MGNLCSRAPHWAGSDCVICIKVWWLPLPRPGPVFLTSVTHQYTFCFQHLLPRECNWHASLCKKENLLEGYRVILENQMKNSLVKEEALQVPQQQDSARLSFKALHWCNLVPKTLNFTIISQGWASKYQEERIWLAQLESSSISSGQEDLVLIEGHFHRGRRCELIVIQKRCYC